MVADQYSNAVPPVLIAARDEDINLAGDVYIKGNVNDALHHNIEGNYDIVGYYENKSGNLMDKKLNFMRECADAKYESCGEFVG